MFTPEDPDTAQSQTILLVDDDAGDLMLTERTIRATHPSFRVTRVDSGMKLMDYLEGRDQFSDREKFPYPFLVLLDLTMRGMTGLEVLRWLSRNPPHNQIPVHVLSGTDSPELAEITVLLGARSFVSKPLTAEEFQNVVELSDLIRKG